MEIKYFKKIEIPHLQSTIYVNDMSMLKGGTPKGGGYAVRMEKKIRHSYYAIFIDDIERTVCIPENFPMIAHEVMHILQFISQDYGINMEDEQENIAYLMSYILGEIIKDVDFIAFFKGVDKDAKLVSNPKK